MDTILNIDPARFAAILKSFDDISTKNSDDYHSPLFEEDDIYVEGFNEVDFY